MRSLVLGSPDEPVVGTYVDPDTGEKLQIRVFVDHLHYWTVNPNNGQKHYQTEPFCTVWYLDEPRPGFFQEPEQGWWRLEPGTRKDNVTHLRALEKVVNDLVQSDYEAINARINAFPIAEAFHLPRIHWVCGIGQMHGSFVFRPASEYPAVLAEPKSTHTAAHKPKGGVL